MSRPQDVGDNKNYYADDTVGFDGEGYVLANGDDDGDRQVKKNDGTEPFVGINHMGTWNHDKSEVLEGEPVAVHHEGEVNVLCEPGTEYTHGDLVYASVEYDGIAAVEGDENAGDEEVGRVVEGEDLTGEDAPGVVKVNITGRV